MSWDCQARNLDGIIKENPSRGGEVFARLDMQPGKNFGHRSLLNLRLRKWTSAGKTFDVN